MININYKFEWISAKEVYEEYGIRESELQRFALEERLTARLIGGDEYWSRKEIEEWIDYLEERGCL